MADSVEPGEFHLHVVVRFERGKLVARVGNRDQLLKCRGVERILVVQDVVIAIDGIGEIEQ